MGLNLSGYGPGDILKLVANLTGAAAGGYATGGAYGALGASLMVIAALLQSPPGHISEPK
jgi:hypothetical protein